MSEANAPDTPSALPRGGSFFYFLNIGTKTPGVLAELRGRCGCPCGVAATVAFGTRTVASGRDATIGRRVVIIATDGDRGRSPWVQSVPGH